MISVCVPTRGRPGRFEQMASSAVRTAAGRIEIVGWRDAEDETEYPKLKSVRYGAGPRPMAGDSVQMSGLWHRAWLLARGSIAMLCGDDVVFDVPGWDRMVEAEFARVPDRILMVYGSDGHGDKSRPVMPFVSREWIAAAGEFTPDDYPGWMADEWVWAMAAEIGRVVFLPGLRTTHHWQEQDDSTYRDAVSARARAGGLAGLKNRFYSAPEVARRDAAIRGLRAAMDPDGPVLVPRPVPPWFRESVERDAASRAPSSVHKPTPQIIETPPTTAPVGDSPSTPKPTAGNPSRTLAVVHAWAGNAEFVREALPVHRRHDLPVLILSPEDAPVRIDDVPGVQWKALGRRGYFGQESLDRERAHLEYLLTLDYDWFLLNDDDSFLLSPKIPDHVYAEPDVFWSNEVREWRPHKSPYPKIAFHPPYFAGRAAIEKMLTAADLEAVRAHPITPFIDWYLVALACESGARHSSHGDRGASLIGWKHDPLPETKELGHDFKHVQNPGGRFDGERKMLMRVRDGAVWVHSIKHKNVLDGCVAAADAFADRRRKNAALRASRAQVVRERISARPAPAYGKPPPTPPIELKTVSILVPFRPDSENDTRTPIWEHVRRRWETALPEAEIVVGEDSGNPFSKTTAVNEAFLRSAGDALVVTDSDVWMDRAGIEAAVAAAAETARLVVPWSVMHRLTAADTIRLLSGELDDPDEEMFERTLGGGPVPYTAGGLFVIRRDAFAAVNGMDPRFRGWGYEDISFRRQCDALIARTAYMSGHAWTLEHHRPLKSGVGRVWENDNGRMNQVLNGRYIKAERHHGTMVQLAAEHPLGKPAASVRTSAPLVTERI